MIVRDRREGEGEVKREGIDYHGVHWEDQGLCAVLVCGTMLLPCLFVCMCQHWHKFYTQDIVTYRSERSEWSVMSNSRGNKDREMFIPISNSWQILCLILTLVGWRGCVCTSDGIFTRIFCMRLMDPSPVFKVYVYMNWR